MTDAEILVAYLHHCGYLVADGQEELDELIVTLRQGKHLMPEADWEPSEWEDTPEQRWDKVVVHLEKIFNVPEARQATAEALRLFWRHFMQGAQTR